jgi:hypothetical protein
MALFDNGNRRKNPVSPAISKAIELAFSGGNVPSSASIVWEWVLPEFVSFAGQATRLPGGATLVTASEHKKVYEVDAEGQVIWTLALTDAPPGGPQSIYRAERVPSLFTGSSGASLERCGR